LAGQGFAHLGDGGAGLGAAAIGVFQPGDEALGLLLEKGTALALDGKRANQPVYIGVIVAAERVVRCVVAGNRVGAHGLAQLLQFGNAGFKLAITHAQALRQIGALALGLAEAAPQVSSPSPEIW